MNFNNFTIKAQEVVQKAVQLTRDNGNQAIEPVHLLKALLSEGDAVTRFIFQKLDIIPANVERPLEAALQQLPRVSGGEPYLSNDASKVLEKASDIASAGGDQYVTVNIETPKSLNKEQKELLRQFGEATGGNEGVKGKKKHKLL